MVPISYPHNGSHAWRRGVEFAIALAAFALVLLALCSPAH